MIVKDDTTILMEALFVLKLPKRHRTKERPLQPFLGNMLSIYNRVAFYSSGASGEVSAGFAPAFSSAGGVSSSAVVSSVV